MAEPSGPGGAETGGSYPSSFDGSAAWAPESRAPPPSSLSLPSALDPANILPACSPTCPHWPVRAARPPCAMPGNCTPAAAAPPVATPAAAVTTCRVSWAAVTSAFRPAWLAACCMPMLRSSPRNCTTGMIIFGE